MPKDPESMGIYGRAMGEGEEEARRATPEKWRKAPRRTSTGPASLGQDREDWTPPGRMCADDAAFALLAKRILGDDRAQEAMTPEKEPE